MKKITFMLTSILLCVTMLILGPAQVAASAAEEAKKVYISEVKVGMGKTSEEAAKELLAEGFTILKMTAENMPTLTRTQVPKVS